MCASRRRTLVNRWAVDPGKQRVATCGSGARSLIDVPEEMPSSALSTDGDPVVERRAPPDGVLETGTRGGNAIRVGVANETGQALDGFVE